MVFNVFLRCCSILLVVSSVRGKLSDNQTHALTAAAADVSVTNGFHEGRTRVLVKEKENEMTVRGRRGWCLVVDVLFFVVSLFPPPSFSPGNRLSLLLSICCSTDLMQTWSKWM